MTPGTAHSPQVNQLIERWISITASASEIERVGVAPRHKKKRGLVALLAQQTDPQLDLLQMLCKSKSEECGSAMARDFWRNRIRVIDEVRRTKKAILERERRRKRAVKKAKAEELERAWKEKQARTLDSRLGLSRVQSDQIFGVNKPVQGGAPGSKR